MLYLLGIIMELTTTIDTLEVDTAFMLGHQAGSKVH